MKHDYTLTECASILGIKTDTLKKWHSQGCPGEKLQTTWRFSVADVFAWRIERERELAAPPKPEIPADLIGIDPDYERARRDKEMADKLALANMRTRGETVEIASVKKLGEKVMVAIRQKILSFRITDDEKDALLIELMNLKNIDWTRDA